jgi:cobalt transporter subunit CbtA
MDLFRSIVFSALVAGALTGVVSSALHLTTTVPLIEQAEVFEHEASESGSAISESAHEEHAHSHAEPRSDYQRGALTVLATVLAYIGFALVVSAAGTVTGTLFGWWSGLIWGFAGFAAFTLAPSFGLPPELPAMPAAELGARQLWWVFTVILTFSGMGIAFYFRSPAGVIAAVALVLIPHIVGAPQPVDETSPIPGDLHATFEITTIVVSLVSWSLMGTILGWLRGRANKKAVSAVLGYV